MGLEFSQQELAAMRAVNFVGFTDEQFELAIAECKRRNLVPGQHVHFSLRSSKEWSPEMNASVFVKKMVKVTTIEAARLIAQRTGEYQGQGQGVFYYLDKDGNPSIVSNIPLPDPKDPSIPRIPWAASIPIFRKGFREPVQVAARFDAYAQGKKGDNGKTIYTGLWSTRGPEMLLKCSTVAALRASFAEELGGMYLSEEMEREPVEETPQTPATPLVEAPKATLVPTINHAPATPTDEARPVRQEEPAAESSRKRTAAETTLVEVRKETAAVAQPSVEVAALTPALPTEDERKATGAQIRTYTADRSIDSKKLCEFVLQRTGKEDTKKIPQADWVVVLAEIEDAFKAGTLRDLIDPPAEEPIF